MPATEPTLPVAIDYSVSSTTVRRVPTSGAITTAAAFQAALDDAELGDKIVLDHTQTFVDEFLLKVPTGTLAGSGGDNWVTITTDAEASLPAFGTRVDISHAAYMPTIKANTGAFGNKAIACNAEGVHHYRFVGIYFTTPASYPGVGSIVNISPYLDYSASANYPHHISVERCIVKPHYDFGTSFAVVIEGDDWQVVDSHFDECKRQGTGNENDGEAKCIFTTFDSGPFKVHNNYIYGLGSNLFIGDSLLGGVAITPGYEYKQPHDGTITLNTIGRKLQWKRDHSTYFPCCDLAGTGTVSSSSTTVTFGTSQTGLTGQYIKGVTSGAVGKITSGSGTSWVIEWRSGSAFSAGESWRYNSNNLSSKNLLELKAGNAILIEANTFENMWNDGQFFALTLTPRSFGWFADYTVKNNTFDNCTGPVNFSAGDSQSGNQLGASPYHTKRVRFSNNLIKNLQSSDMTSLAAYAYTFAIGPFQNLYGCLNGYSAYSIYSSGTALGSATITATGGSSSTDGPFTSYMVGQEIHYLTGRANITGFTDSNNVDVTITTAFPSSVLSPGATGSLWYVGPSAIVGTSVYWIEDLIIEHNTVAGSLCGNRKTPGVFSGPDDTNLCPNFTFRSNLIFSVDGGIGTDFAGLVGTDAINYFAASATKDVRNNVLFGPDLVGGGINYQSRYNGEAVDEVIGFHDPDETGSGSGGSVGFVNYAGGNFRLTGTYTTAAHDGTMVGVDHDALEAAQGGGGSSSTSSNTGAGALALVGVGSVLGFGISPATP